MNPFSEDLKDVLVADGMGVFAATTGTGVFVNFEPDSPNQVLTIYDTPAGDPLEVMDGTVKPLLPVTAQVRSRSTTYLGSYGLLCSAIQILRRRGSWVVEATGQQNPTIDYPVAKSAVKYWNLFQSGSETFLMKDRKERFIWTVNFRATRMELVS